jgi:hypothetical protein
MATEYTLRRKDRRPLGTFVEVQATLRRLFPGVQFWWTTSGPEKVQQAEENGGPLPPHIKEWMLTLPSMLDGACEGDDWLVEFGLGPTEPVPELYVQPRSDGGPELMRLLDALEAEYGNTLVVSGSEPEPA